MALHPVDHDHWPYPRFIAHRGAGKLAPENTLGAFRLGASHGYRMFECDVKLSADRVPFLMHDATLDRTTDAAARLPASASRIGGDHPWGELAQFDAGAWHSRAFAGEPLASLQSIAGWCLANGLMLNIEIKPTPGTERQTGEQVAHAAARLWQAAALPPLLTSFSVDALEGALAAAPDLPRGLLLDQPDPAWCNTARQLGCVAVVFNYALWNADTIAEARAARLRTLSYTVNDPWVAARLAALGTDGIITDRVDLFAPVG